LSPKDYTKYTELAKNQKALWQMMEGQRQRHLNAGASEDDTDDQEKHALGSCTAASKALSDFLKVSARHRTKVARSLNC
jgi:hypothetical protein